MLERLNKMMITVSIDETRATQRLRVIHWTTDSRLSRNSTDKDGSEVENGDQGSHATAVATAETGDDRKEKGRGDSVCL